MPQHSVCLVYLRCAVAVADKTQLQVSKVIEVDTSSDVYQDQLMEVLCLVLMEHRLAKSNSAVEHRAPPFPSRAWGIRQLALPAVYLACTVECLYRPGGSGMAEADKVHGCVRAPAVVAPSRLDALQSIPTPRGRNHR